MAGKRVGVDRISYKANNMSTGTFHVIPVQLASGGGKKVPAAPTVLGFDLPPLVPGEGFKEYTGTFATLPGTGFDVRIQTWPDNADKEFPATVVWDNFVLTEVGPAKKQQSLAVLGLSFETSPRVHRAQVVL